MTASAITRVGGLAAVVAVIGLLPWLSGRDPALSVLRARSAEREPTAEALDAVRRELGLDAGPVALFGDWLGGALRGDLGRSWVGGAEVLPSVLAATGVSVALMGVALAVALVSAAALSASTFVRGARGTARARTGASAAVLAALPEFLVATVLLVVLSVWWGWFPPYGWQGPQHLVLPALALGLPAGGILGRLVDDAVPAVFEEQWVVLWRSWGCSPGVIGRAAARRALPAVLPQFGLVAVGLTGGAVAVEVVFAVPGLGRTALGAAEAQDLPLLQGSVLVLVLLGLVGGVLVAGARRRMLGPALRAAALPAPPPVPVAAGRWHRVVVAVSAVVPAVVVCWGLLREPLRVHPTARLAPPGWAHPLGTDALGRDVLARVGHGAAATLTVTVLVCLCSVAVALVVGFLPALAEGAAETANAVPPVIAGILVAATAGPGQVGASIAVGLVSWPPLAAHAAALVRENRAATHVAALRALGAGPTWVLTRHVLPAVAGPVARHAVLRLPGIALALASLGFLGLGAPPPAPEWGLMLAESLPYLERAPWAALAPAAMLLLLATLAVSLSTLSSAARPKRR
ncbi:ABC-type dipeptide/oligopeptide/nickel transport system permease subunit [Saccharothrix carnea]|uniref:ABC-type dipeptide/oligopeptide/nickel transport system permease subunit n=1 Tax=Saccharothrix carnea TaxID=1280637 RepID=A0A2P8I074_SACCR|nr:ABC transporter permease subunit [Saccharothrix carnea]PSL51882.1 ABC-type dipeptide/oligopeptide/nickel transport system permease subunit [Saccharothrix carnea]